MNIEYFHKILNGETGVRTGRTYALLTCLIQEIAYGDTIHGAYIVRHSDTQHILKLFPSILKDLNMTFIRSTHRTVTFLNEKGEVRSIDLVCESEIEHQPDNKTYTITEVDHE